MASVLSISDKLFTMLKEFGVLSFVIALISSLFVQALKNSDDNALSKIKFTPFSIWLLNVITTGVLSIAVIFVFDGLGSIWVSIVYTLLCWVLSWALSILCYDYFLKYLFMVFDIIYNKLKSMRDK